MAQGDGEKKELTSVEKAKQKETEKGAVNGVNGTTEKKEKDDKGKDGELDLPEGTSMTIFAEPLEDRKLIN